MNTWAALAFMGMGGAIVGLFNLMAWKRYNQGKKEGRMYSESKVKSEGNGVSLHKGLPK